MDNNVHIAAGILCRFFVAHITLHKLYHTPRGQDGTIRNMVNGAYFGKILRPADGAVVKNADPRIRVRQPGNEVSADKAAAASNKPCGHSISEQGQGTIRFSGPPVHSLTLIP